MTARSSTGEGPAAWEAWRAERLRTVTAVPGNLSLVAYQPLGVAPAPLEQLPGAIAAADPGGDGALLDLPPTAGATLDGAPAAGRVHLRRLRPDGGPLLHAGRWWVDAFSLDGTDHELRLYDEQAPNRARFAGIETYPYDPAWVLHGTFRARAQPQAVPWGFTRAADTGHAKAVPGSVALRAGGQEHELLAFLDGPALVLTLADGTTGADSYAPGRFLRLPPPAGEDVVVDLNRAFIPPCGFSDAYSCPLPPPQNRLTEPVTAGERHVLWR